MLPLDTRRHVLCERVIHMNWSQMIAEGEGCILEHYSLQDCQACCHMHGQLTQCICTCIHSLENHSGSNLVSVGYGPTLGLLRKLIIESSKYFMTFILMYVLGWSKFPSFCSGKGKVGMAITYMENSHKSFISSWLLTGGSCRKFSWLTSNMTQWFVCVLH